MSRQEPVAKKPPNIKLRRAREIRGWGQKDVANKLNITDDRMVRRWETGGVVPAPHYRQKLCELFGMNAIELGFISDGQEQ